MESSWIDLFDPLVKSISSPEIRDDYISRINNVSTLPIEQQDNKFHKIYYELLGYTNCRYDQKSITDITSLTEVQTVLENLGPGKKIVFIDWDDTVVHWNSEKIIEPEVTKKLFKYMLDNDISFAIITGRFWKSAPNPSARDYDMMYKSIEATMHPILEEIGIPMNDFKDRYLIFDFYDNTDIVGLLYMGIMFGGEKGRIIKSYLGQINDKYDHIIFVDDLDDYHRNVLCHVPGVIALRRKKSQ